MPRSRRISDNETSKHQFAMSDVFWVLFMVAWTAFATVKMFHDVEAYRWQQRVFAEFDSRMPKIIGAAPYDPAVGERLVGEAAGCVIAIAVGLLGIRRRRRRVVDLRVKWISAPQTRRASVWTPQSIVNTTARTMPLDPRPLRKVKSGPLAADRLSFLVRNDHVARLEKEHA
jgi:hypothetical protein